MFTSRLLFAFTILRHMVTVFGDCNYVDNTDKGTREALDLCFAMDVFGNSYKVVHVPISERGVHDFYENVESLDNLETFKKNTYANRNCEGVDPGLERFVREPALLHSETGNTCSAFLFVMEYVHYKDGIRIGTNINLADFDLTNPGIPDINFADISTLFNDCMMYGLGLYSKVTECVHIYNAEGGKDTISRAFYQDDQCTNEIPENKWFPLPGYEQYESFYKKELHESETYLSLRDTNTGLKFLDLMVRDIVCYDEAPIVIQSPPAEAPIEIKAPIYYEAPQYDCNYVHGKQQYSRQALDLCFAMDLFDNSYKLVHKPDLPSSDINKDVFEQHIYGNKNCEGAYRVVSDELETYAMKSDTGKTCSAFLFVIEQVVIENGIRVSPEYTPGIDLSDADLIKPGLTDIHFSSFLYNDCMREDEHYLKVTSCVRIDGKDVIYRALYQDSACTIEVPENKWYKWIATGDEKALYKKELHESDAYLQVRDEATGSNGFDLIVRDIVCYDEAPIAAGENLFYAPNDVNWTYLAVNLLISAVSTLCVVAVCLTAYYWMKRKSGLAYAPVQWAKEVDTEV